MGLWEHINTVLREQLRIRLGRDAQPSAAIIDSQSVKTTEQGGLRGYDGGKKVKGRKRHILVDTQGFILKALVHPANIHDRDGGLILLDGIQYQFPCICHLWVDIGYRGRFVRWVKDTLFWSVEVSRHWWQGIRGVWVPEGQEAPTYPAGFQVLIPHLSL